MSAEANRSSASSWKRSSDLGSYPIPVNFVLLSRSNEEVDQLKHVNPDIDWRMFNDGQESWVLQLYLRLSKLGFPGTLSNTFESNCINVVHNGRARNLPRPRKAFVVGIRADYPSLYWADIQIVQNKNQISKRSFWIPHWPQPGLIPRNSERDDRVERVGYFGLEVNHFTRYFRYPSGIFRVKQEVKAICKRLGLEFVQKGEDDWNDYSDIDVTIAFRSFGERRFNTKPALKMIDAWLAGTAFVGGSDSAFLEVGSPAFNFIRATTAESFERALQRLKEDRALFASLVRRGRDMGEMYRSEQVLEYWECLFVGEILESFEMWRTGRAR